MRFGRRDRNQSVALHEGKDEPDVTGPGDLEVYASIYARGRFVVRNYLSRPAGKLVIYGSLAAGSLTATEPRYSTSVHFDQRLAQMTVVVTAPALRA